MATGTSATTLNKYVITAKQGKLTTYDTNP